MRKQVALIGVAGLLVLAIGSSPRYIEELRIGGGYGDSADGGADFEKDGDFYTDGNAAVGKTLDVAGNVAVGDNASVANTITLNNQRKPAVTTGYESGSYTALQPAPTGTSSACYYAVRGEVKPDTVAAQNYTLPGFLQAGYFYVLPPAPGRMAALGIGVGGGPAFWESSRTGTFTNFRSVNAEGACGAYGLVENWYNIYSADTTNNGSGGGHRRYGLYVCGAGAGDYENLAAYIGYGGSYFGSPITITDGQHPLLRVEDSGDYGTTLVSGNLAVADPANSLGSELTSNGTLEGTYVGGVAPNWAAWTGSGGTGTLSDETGTVHGGSHAQKFTDASVKGLGQAAGASERWCVVTAWIYVVSGDADIWVGNSYQQACMRPNLQRITAGVWTQIEAQFKTTGTTLYLCQGTPTATFILDDISFKYCQGGDVNCANIYATGGAIDGTTIGATTASSVKATTVEATGNVTLAAGTDIRPSANSTTALNIAQADGTDWVIFDTTNKRVGINMAPTYALDVTGSIRATSGSIWLGSSYGIKSDGVLRLYSAGTPSIEFTSNADASSEIQTYAYGKDSANASKKIAGERYKWTASTAGAEVGYITWDIMGATAPGTFAYNEMTLNNTGLTLARGLSATTVTGSSVVRCSTVTTFTADDTTPAVNTANTFKIPATWTAGHDITAFDNGAAGQEITVIGADTDCNVVDGGTLLMNGNWNAADNATLTLVSDGSKWYEKCRSAN